MANVGSLSGEPATVVEAPRDAVRRSLKVCAKCGILVGVATRARVCEYCGCDLCAACSFTPPSSDAAAKHGRARSNSHGSTPAATAEVKRAWCGDCDPSCRSTTSSSTGGAPPPQQQHVHPRARGFTAAVVAPRELEYAISTQQSPPPIVLGTRVTQGVPIAQAIPFFGEATLIVKGTLIDSTDPPTGPIVAAKVVFAQPIMSSSDPPMAGNSVVEGAEAARNKGLYWCSRCKKPYGLLRWRVQCEECLKYACDECSKEVRGMVPVHGPNRKNSNKTTLCITCYQTLSAGK